MDLMKENPGDLLICGNVLNEAIEKTFNNFTEKSSDETTFKKQKIIRKSQLRPKSSIKLNDKDLLKIPESLLPKSNI